MTLATMPTQEVVYLWLLIVAMFFVAATFALRLGCHSANVIGGWTGRFAPLVSPTYRACLRIVLFTVIVLSIATAVESSIIGWLTGAGFSEQVMRPVATALEWLAFVFMVAAGLSELQPARNRLVVPAAALQFCFLLAGAFGLAILIEFLMR